MKGSLPGKLEDSPLGVRSAGTDKHILGVLNSSNGTGSQQDLLPGLLQVDDVDTIVLLLEDVLLHGGLAVVRPNVGGGGQHLGDVILLQSREKLLIFTVNHSSPTSLLH